MEVENSTVSSKQGLQKTWLQGVDTGCVASLLHSLHSKVRSALI